VYQRLSHLTIKFPLFVLAALLSVIWGLVGYFNVALKNDLEQLLSAQQYSAASVIAASIDQQVRLRLRALEDLATLFGERGLIQDSRQADALLHDNLTVGALFNGGFFLLDAGGVCIVDAPRMTGRRGLNFAHYEEFSALLQQRKPAIGNPRSGKLTGRPLVAMSAPIIDATDQIAGVLIGLTYLDSANYISEVIATYKGGSSEVSIIDPSSAGFVAVTDADRGGNPLFDRYREGHEGSGIATNSRGIEELVSGRRMASTGSGRRMASTGWIAAVALPVEAAFAPMIALRHTLLAAALVLSVILPWLAAALVGHWRRRWSDIG